MELAMPEENVIEIGDDNAVNNYRIPDVKANLEFSKLKHQYFKNQTKLKQMHWEMLSSQERRNTVAEIRRRVMEEEKKIKDLKKKIKAIRKSMK